MNCGYTYSDTILDTTGNRMIWKCYCKTTACQKPLNYSKKLYNKKAEKDDIEERFYKKAFETKSL